MSEKADGIIIVGAGHAGGRAAQAIRAAGFERPVLLIGEEAHAPYERPPLSKALLVGEDGVDAARVHDPEWYDAHDVELLADTRVVEIDAQAKRVLTENGPSFGYDKLLLATGARVRRLALPGVDLAGVHYLRTFDDTVAIRSALGPGCRVVVIGGGFIGLEAASSAAKRGAKVTVLEMADQLMGRAVAGDIGAWYADLHRRHGVDVRLSVAIDALVGRDRVDGVALAGGETVGADLVIVGIGILPNVELAEAVGLTVDNGVVVDAFGRTSDPDIYAAGDVANQPNEFLGRNIRLESYRNAQDHAMAVGRNMAGAETAYSDKLWVWSDQFDVNLQMQGMPDDYDRLVRRGDPATGAFMVFYMAGRKICAVNAVNMGKEMRIAERLMLQAIEVDDADLADTSLRLRNLVKR